MAAMIMPEIWNKRSRFSRSLILALLIHLFFVLFLLLFKPDEQITILFEVQFVPVKNSIPEVEKLEIREKIQKVDEQKKLQVRNKQKATTNTAEQAHSTKKEKSLSGREAAESDFEKQLFNKNSTYTAKSSRSGNNSNNWNSHSDAEPGRKKTAGENVKVPEGKTGTGSVSWNGRSRKMIFRPDIPYPLHFRKQGIQSTVVLLIEVEPSGVVSRVSVLRSSGHSQLDILAKNGMKKARFSMVAGETVDRGELEVQFSLR